MMSVGHVFDTYISFKWSNQHLNYCFSFQSVTQRLDKGCCFIRQGFALCHLIFLKLSNTFSFFTTLLKLPQQLATDS